jgi:uncharacterized protein YjbJ (UPF0337 family)
MNAKSEQIAGHVKEATGIALDDDDLKAEGKAQRLGAEVDEKTEAVKAKVDEKTDELKAKAEHVVDVTQEKVDGAFGKAKDALKS